MYFKNPFFLLLSPFSMKKLSVLIPQVLLGAFLLVFGLNKFFGFIPMTPPEGDAGAFLAALGSSGYIMPVVGAMMILVALGLISNRFVALSLILLAPLSANWILFHAVLAPAGLLVPVVIAIVQIYLMWAYREKYCGLFTSQ